jgi:hypothetical protein
MWNVIKEHVFAANQRVFIMLKSHHRDKLRLVEQPAGHAVVSVLTDRELADKTNSR